MVLMFPYSMIKIFFTSDYYIKESSNFLLDIPIPAQTGFTTATRNVGSIRNSGIELTLGYRQANNKFNWSVSLNVTTLKNEILSFTEGVTSISNLSNAFGFIQQGANIWTIYSNSTVGGNVGAFYGFKTEGLFQSKEEVDAVNAQAKGIYGPSAYYQYSVTSAGDRKFVDLNGDSRITDADRAIIGTPIPKMFGGLNFDASYKNFDISLFLYYSYGNEIFNY